MTDVEVPGRPPRWLPLLLLAIVVVAYSSSLGGAFVFDDRPNILDNASIHQLWPPWHALWGERVNSGIAGRPLLSLSLALNWAVSQDRPWSYHLVNLAIHALATLLLFGLVRRTLVTPPLAPRWGSRATPVAFAVALLWGVHPLTTQAVTYIVQRAESLMGLCFLATVYAAVRGWQSPSPGRWHALAVAACLGGVGCKEVIAAAPLLVLLWELVFMGRGPLAAVRRSPGLYAGFVACLALLAALVAGGATVQSVPDGRLAPWLPHLLTQGQVILHYLGLAVWPARLAIDDGWRIAPVAASLPAAAIVGLLVLLTTWGVVRRRPAAYPGAWFFSILATTSLVPLPDLTFEHRMYLPLAALVTLIVMGTVALAERWSARLAPAVRRRGLAVLLALAAVALGARTWSRNLDYRDPLVLWQKTAKVRPGNARALTNVGVELWHRGRTRDAVVAYRRAIAVDDSYALAHRNLALALADLGDVDGAIREHRRAIALHPTDAGWYNDLGLLLRSVGRPGEAIPVYEEAIRLRPDSPGTAPLHYNLGVAYQAVGRRDEAIAQYRRALELDPGHAPSRQRLAALVGPSSP